MVHPIFNFGRPQNIVYFNLSVLLEKNVCVSTFAVLLVLYDFKSLLLNFANIYLGRILLDLKVGPMFNPDLCLRLDTV